MKKTILFSAIISVFFTTVIIVPQSLAQPYGKGPYDANVPYGNQTSLSIATSGNVTIPITPASAGSFSTGTNTVTVTSTDVMGYKLYIRALSSTNMNNYGTLLPASSNSSPAALSINTWGYNTDASANFTGMTLNDTLIRSTTSPASTGDATTVTYGMKLDLSKPAGNYATTVIYTAIPQTN